MNFKTSVSYERAPSGAMIELLKPGGFLRPLIDLSTHPPGGIDLDIHFYGRRRLRVYRGLTRILDASLSREGNVSITAHRQYASQACAEGVMREWRTDEDGFADALTAYLSGVDVAPRHTDLEGHVQMLWSRVTQPWMPFDREARLAYTSSERRAEIKGIALRPAMEAHARLTELARTSGRALPGEVRSHTGSELDQLAVDPDGRLVILELKDGSKGSADLYYAPLQLLEYVCEWDSVLEGVRDDLQSVIDARVEVGLTPSGATRLAGGIRPVVGFGPDIPSDNVMDHYREVVDVVNEHLPSGVQPVETWNFTDSCPSRV